MKIVFQASNILVADYQADDTPEDKEARSLLNKFIGSQVILSGMETRSSSSPSGTTSTTVKRTTTTSSTSKVSLPK